MCSLTRKFELQCTLIPCSDSLIINYLRLLNTYCLHGTLRIRIINFLLPACLSVLFRVASPEPRELCFFLGVGGGEGVRV